LNTPGGAPLTLAGLSGQVVLIEFWTFACGNCLRTVPFLRRMHRHYGPELVVVGIHTPEFPFERPVRNVERAVRERGIAFPVGLDNDYQVWDAYDNRYWPSQYLVDPAGRIRFTHIGEGGYCRMESAIRTLLEQVRHANDRPGGAEITTRVPLGARRRRR
jgi:thiol-disulfide isomerase/thioredoxin